MSEQTYTLEEIKKHNSLNDLWLIYKDDVFDVTKFVEDHPGGEEVLKATGGADSTTDFDDVGHSESAKKKMMTFRIGRVAGAGPRVEEPKKEKKSSTSTATTRPAAAVAQPQGGLGPLKIPIILVILAIMAYFIMGSDK
eukprot:gene10857-12647_t